MRFSQPSIYLTTYKGKKYVGQTNGHRKDYYGSGKVIQRILKKYGPSVLKVQLLETTTLDKLNEREIFWIAKLKPELNCTSGGEGGDTGLTEEGRKSKSEKMKAFPRSKEWNDNIRKSKIGKKLSDYHKKRMSEVRIGKKLSKEHREAISKGMKGNIPWNKGLRNAC